MESLVMFMAKNRWFRILLAFVSLWVVAFCGAVAFEVSLVRALMGEMMALGGVVALVLVFLPNASTDESDPEAE